jgi:hypothetical protein
MPPELLDPSADDEPIGKVNADGAYDTRGRHAAIVGRSVCAVIPAHKDAQPWLDNTPGAPARNDTVRSVRGLGRRYGGGGPGITEEPAKDQNPMLQAPRGMRHGAQFRQAGDTCPCLPAR